MALKSVNKTLAEQLRRDGKTYPEIASILNCSVSWAKQHLSNIPKKKICKCCGTVLVGESDA